MNEMNVSKIVSALRGKKNSNGWLCHCPAHADKTPSLQVSTGTGGKPLVKCYAGCSQGAVIESLRQKELWPKKAKKVAKTTSDKNNRLKAREILKECVFTDAPETKPLHRYLNQRGLNHIPYRGSLYYHPALPYRDGAEVQSYPALVGAFVNIDGDVLGIQRVYLAQDGQKANVSSPKKTLGSVRGGAIHIGNSSKKLAITEGVETGMAVREATGMATWVAGSASALEHLVFPHIMEEIHIWADKDANHTGLIAAEALAKKFTRKGGKAFIHMPHLPIPDGEKNIDWLDVLNQGGKKPFLDSLQQTPTWQPDKDDPIEASTPTMDDTAYFGLAGEYVKMILPHTEASPVGLLSQFLTCFGNVVGRLPEYKIEASRQGTNQFIVLVGNTAKARKGTAYDQVMEVFKKADPTWCSNCVKSGLSSGEGLLYELRDAVVERKMVKDKQGNADEKEVIKDPGVADKRLLAYQSEFASVLKVMKREGNILSCCLRDGWDGKPLESLSKSSRYKATDPHLSVIGHITVEDLKSNFSDEDKMNGLGNRYLWYYVERSKKLPQPSSPSAKEKQKIIAGLRQAIKFARRVSVVKMSGKAQNLWNKIYLGLDDVGGVFGAMIARDAPQILRLALLYALLERKKVIMTRHLEAAYAVWRYCENTCRYLFGDLTGNKMACTILKALHSAPNGLTRTEIHRLFRNNKSGGDIEKALNQLHKLGKAIKRSESDGGKTKDRWFEA